MEIKEFKEGDNLQFVSFYMECGDIQKTPDKEGLIVKMAEVTKTKNGLVFYRVAGESGERKCSISAMDKFRDFGTSVYGLFTKISDQEILEGLVSKLDERIKITEDKKNLLLNKI